MIVEKHERDDQLQQRGGREDDEQRAPIEPLGHDGAQTRNAKHAQSAASL
jgi:hypothetical protein